MSEHPPWTMGEDPTDEVYDALVPLDGFPKGSRGGPRIYSYKRRWWVVVTLSDFGDALVGQWGDLPHSDREDGVMSERLRVTDEPDEDGQYLLYFLRNGATVKCGYIYADAVKDARRLLLIDGDEA